MQSSIICLYLGSKTRRVPVNPGKKSGPRMNKGNPDMFMVELQWATLNALYYVGFVEIQHSG